MTRRVRWTCSKHPGVLAPSRLRRDDIRRYCWPCSKAAGRLVERTAPALDKFLRLAHRWDGLEGSDLQFQVLREKHAAHRREEEASS